MWKKESLKKFNNKCYVTGLKNNLEIHHTKPFYVLRDEAFNELNLPIYEILGEYSHEERKRINLKLKEKHNDFVGIPLTKEIHDLFHRVYGRKDTTMEDLMEFKQRFLSGEFNIVTSAL